MSKYLYSTPMSFFSKLYRKDLDFLQVSEQNVFKEFLLMGYGPCKSAEICRGICFEFCVFFEFPSYESITSHSEEIETVFINKSKLSRISAIDLKGFDFLTGIFINNCEIEELPGDLFKHTPGLQYISFFSNRIKSIGKDLLKPLRSLKYFNLGKNKCINYCFSANAPLKGSLQELQERIDAMNENDIEKKLEALKNENQVLRARCDKLESHLKANPKYQLQLIKEEEPKMFVLQVNETEFRVQMQTLQKHSKTIAKLINENPGLETLKLTDISEELVNEILNFMCIGNPPNEKIDPILLLAASCRLEVDVLSDFLAENLQEKVTPDNALDILILCNKYNMYEDLKMKAFVEFEKNFPLLILEPEMASQPEELKKIFKAKMEIY